MHDNLMQFKILVNIANNFCEFLGPKCPNSYTTGMIFVILYKQLNFSMDKTIDTGHNIDNNCYAN